MKLSRLSIVSAAVMMTTISSAHAGFLFSGPPVKQQAPAPQVQHQYQAPAGFPSAPMDAPMDAPMPIVPAPEVEAMTLSPMPDAAPVRPLNAQPVNHGALAINPYPLQASGATHNVNNAVSLDQAMMEGAGNLRPVVTPGSDTGHGRIARAAITSRFDGNPSVPPQKPAQHFDYNASSMTALPGGEVAPLNHDVSPVIQAQPLMPRPAPTLPPATPVQAAASAQSEHFTEAVGFGRDLPLALALTQVVPADYSFSFSPAIDAGATVSWQGGQPWNVVLNEMLSAQGLNAVISGKQVTIQSAT